MFAAPVMAQLRHQARGSVVDDDHAGPVGPRDHRQGQQEPSCNKHSRVICCTGTVAHKPVMTVRHARHFNVEKSHKVAVAHKPVMTVKHARHFNAAKSHKIAVAHKPVMTVKHARHFNAGKSHKVAGTANKVAAAKSATRSSAN